MSRVVVLRGDARARGLGQAQSCPEMAEAVRSAIRTRLAGTPRDAAFLAAQRGATLALAPEAWEECAGIAAGFGLDADEVFDFLHLGCLADLARLAAEPDGCTAFARDGVVAKNRDFRPEHVALQRIFLLQDPAWRGRRILCVGSLGAPGAWSSGMNSDGFALADTQIATADHGPGMLRYFLMNRLLAGCATVAEALAAIRAMPHAGGGSLVMADASGAGAAVELRHGRVDIEQGACVSRTNHYTAAPERLAAVAHSAGRLETLRTALAEGARDPRKLSSARDPRDLSSARDPRDLSSARDPRDLLALHAPTAICRHAPDPSPTLAGAVWDTLHGTARIALGPPCSTPWRIFEPAAGGWRETHASA